MMAETVPSVAALWWFRCDAYLEMLMVSSRCCRVMSLVVLTIWFFQDLMFLVLGSIAMNARPRSSSWRISLASNSVPFAVIILSCSIDFETWTFGLFPPTFGLMDS